MKRKDSEITKVARKSVDTGRKNTYTRSISNLREDRQPMMIARDDEEKRSRIWRVTTVVSSLLIVLIAVYLLTKLFTSNPLEGEWEDEDGSLGLKISANGEMYVDALELEEAGDAKVPMTYTLDMEEKTISIHMKAEDLEEAFEASDGGYTKEALSNAVSPVVTTFDYSVENNQLTLTEREYGEQMIFLKK